MPSDSAVERLKKFDTCAVSDAPDRPAMDQVYRACPPPRHDEETP